MTKPLQNFVIVVDGKPFIKGFDRGEVPTMRADFKWKKFKPTRYVMADITIVDLIVEAIMDGKQQMPVYSESQLVDCIDGVIENPELSLEITIAIINANGFPNLTPAQLRAIIKGFSSKLA